MSDKDRPDYHCPDCGVPLHEGQPGVPRQWSIRVHSFGDSGIGGPLPLFVCRSCGVYYSEKFLTSCES